MSNQNAANYTVAENIAAFLFSNTQSFQKQWAGRLNKDKQLELFGVYLGKGTIVIDPICETVTHVVKVCFGTDTDWTAQIRWDGRVNWMR